MENHDRHYMALGLQRGATLEEVHAAFQHMSVKYHPDNDSSLDAQMKFHEARQAYTALSKPAEPSFTPEPPPNAATREQASGASNSPGGGRQQNAHNQNFTGFTNTATGAKKDTANSGGFNGPARDHPDFKEFFRDYTGEKPEEPKVFANISLHDYFFRPRLILTVIGSIVLIFLAGRYINILTTIPLPFTDESSARFFRHTAVFVLISWVIYWCIRFNHPSQMPAYAAIFILGLVYALWISFNTLPEFRNIRHFWGNPSRRSDMGVPGWFFLYFILTFCIATCSLEGGGIRASLSKFYNTASKK